MWLLYKPTCDYSKPTCEYSRLIVIDIVECYVHYIAYLSTIVMEPNITVASQSLMWPISRVAMWAMQWYDRIKGLQSVLYIDMAIFKVMCALVIGIHIIYSWQTMVYIMYT